MSEITQPLETKNNKKKIIIISSLLLILIIGVIFFIRSSQYETTDNAQIDADVISVKTSVSGYIKSILFKDNQTVNKGDTLFILDDVELKAKVAQAEAALANAHANLIASISNVKVSSQNASAVSLSSNSILQNITAASSKLKKAKEDLNRTKNLFDVQAATTSDLENAKTNLDVTQAQYDATLNQFQSSSAQSKGALAQVSSQQALIKLSEAMVSQREAELKLAKNQLSYATIIAPCNGVVSRRSVEEGQFVSIGTPFCSIINYENIWISANFKETQINKLYIGQEVDIKIDAYPSIKLKGNIQSFIGATGSKFSLLPPDNSTGNFVKIVQRVPLKIVLTEIDSTQKNLLFPGLSAFVSVHLK